MSGNSLTRVLLAASVCCPLYGISGVSGTSSRSAYLKQKDNMSCTSTGYAVSNLCPDDVRRLKTVCLVSQASVGPDLDFDIDIPPWSEVDTSSTCTGTRTTPHTDISVKHGYHMSAGNNRHLS